MSEWKTYKLGDVVAMRNGKKRPKEEGTYPVYGGNGILDYTNKYNAENVIVVGRVGAYCGSVYRCKQKCWISDNAICVQSKSIIDDNFLFYLMSSLDFHHFHIGGAQPLLTQDIIGSFEISLPSLTEQKRIADILSAIDDKIELNRRINANLEQQAQALYKSWFVDADSTGWETKRLADFFNVITGKKDANYSTKDGVYPFFTCSQDILKAPNYSFEGAAILLAGNGDFNVKRYIGKFEAYQRTYVLIPFEKRYHSFLYLLIKYHLQEITGGSRGSVIKFITKGNIADFTFTMPPYSIDEKLSLFDSLFNEIDKNITEINNLSTIRDTLLPKLMSGEITV
ncbi:MAG: restriction endonuclease subunit S [Paludibacteraceae bacterium]|nr:restriction endonuclease subunit S [Paludibacteraceae bacterium]